MKINIASIIVLAVTALILLGLVTKNLLIKPFTFVLGENFIANLFTDFVETSAIHNSRLFPCF